MTDNFTFPNANKLVRTTDIGVGRELHVFHFMQSANPSASNTTTTPLSSAATFTGVGEVAPADGVVVSCKTDNSGTLFFDFSNDGTNFDTFPTNGFKITANIHEYHSAKVNGRYFRVRLVNDTGAQTFLRLYVYFGPHTHPNAPLNQNLGGDSDATLVRVVDSMLDISAGRFGGFSPINKFGRAPNGVQTTATDIWDRADATPTQQVWTAPTQARVHAIVSSSASDDGAPVGVGARTIRVSGLVDWDTAETSEVVTLNGTASVNTANSYVIIHRMRVVTSGETSRNVGTITATAATDATITAVVLPGNGTTEMAIYGVPSVQRLQLTQLFASLQKSSGTAANIVVDLFSNPEPETQLPQFTKIDIRGLQSTGTSSMSWPYIPYLTIEGPAILKVSCTGSAADLDVTAGFSGILVDV